MAENAFYARQAPNAGAREKSASLKRSYDKFLAVFPELLEKHRGEYIAIHDGQILGIESNENILVQLPRDKNIPLFIARIEPPREVSLMQDENGKTSEQSVPLEPSEEKLKRLAGDLAIHCTGHDPEWHGGNISHEKHQSIINRYHQRLKTPECKDLLIELWRGMQERQAKKEAVEKQLTSATESEDEMAIISATIAYLIERG